MTTETSNARGEVVAWEARDPDDGTRWVTRHARERDGWMGLGRTIRPLTYADAAPPPAADCPDCLNDGCHCNSCRPYPPPAAARGDVRGLVAKWRREADEFYGHPGETRLAAVLEACANELESALAAEGVQAGEVVYAVQTGDADEKGNLLYAIADEPFPMADNWRLYTSALIQQPEARGVVDEAMVERAYDTYCAYTPKTPQEARVMLKDALTAALATQHQEPTT